MANAVKRISVMRGYDVSGYTLQCFGGAGGQHACQVADALGMMRVFIHPLAGVLSAYGMGLADQIAMREGALEKALDEPGVRDARILALRLRAQCLAELEAQGLVPAATNAAALDAAMTNDAAADDASLRAVIRAQVRYQGTDTPLACELPMAGSTADAVASIRGAFEARYRRRFAFLMPDHALVIESVTVECIAAGLDAAGGGAEGLAALTPTGGRRGLAAKESSADGSTHRRVDHRWADLRRVRRQPIRRR